jgi:polyhydroxyalkanoate synthase subunit PhaC
MSETENPFEQFMRQWFERASDFTASVQELVNSTSQAAKETPGADPASAFSDFARGWNRALSDLTILQNQVLQHWLADLPAVGQERLDAQTFGQLNRLATSNWEEELRRFSEKPSEMIARVKGADPDRMAHLVESMLAEYVSDLQALKPEDFEIDTKPLAEAWGKVLKSSADEEASRIVKHFIETMTVKAKYGGEYYADPNTTPVGQTPRELVFRKGKIELYKYRPQPETKQANAAPVLIVYSLINKPYILDLIPGYSFIEHLLSAGLDVYLVEWGQTEPGDRTTSLDSYIEPGISSCVDAICKMSGAEKVSLFGHCIGGNLALMYAALYPERVDRIVALTTPLTAAEGGVVALWTDKYIFPVDDIVDSFGHMPAKLIRYTFMALKPYYEVLKWKMFMQNLGNEQVMALFGPIDRWANENVDIPGEVFRKFVHEVFHADRFRKGQTRINGKSADLGAISCPLLNLAATRDWIVPLDSCKNLGDLVSSEEKLFIPIEGTHVSIMIDPRSRPLWNTISEFLAARKN